MTIDFKAILSYKIPGKKNTNISLIKKISDSLGIKISDLLDGKMIAIQ